MKIITWNLQNRNEEFAIKAAVNFLPFNEIDLVMLTGCANLVEVKSFLNEAGFRYQILSANALEQNGVLIASRITVLNLSEDPLSVQDDIWLEMFFPIQALTVLVVYMPDTGDTQTNEALRQKLFQYAEVKIDTKTMIIGNFGIKAAHPGSVFNFKNYFRNIGFLGWSDAWRSLHPITYEYTWFSNLKKGLQFDFLFLSPPLREFLLNAYHSRITSDGKRSKPASGALIVELQSF